MEQKNSSILTLSKEQSKEVESYCRLNELDVQTFINDCFKQGFLIEKNGLLNPLKTGGVDKKWVEKEVIVEKRVEIPVEVIKEVPVEVVVTKIEYICDDTKTNELLLKIQQLEQEFSTKTTEISTIKQEFSTITTENENIFHYKMSKKDEELDELRRTLDEHLSKPPVEVVVEKETTDNLSKSKLDALQNTLSKVRQETLEKDKKIKELEQTIQEIQKFQENKQAVYLKGSNLDNKLYK